MTNISAQSVKNLRDRTGAGMMECKRALQESGGDDELALDWLRKQGLSKAAKRSERQAQEGLVAAYAAADGSSVALVEVNCETDFVSRTPDFKNFVDMAVQAVNDLSPRGREEILLARVEGETLQDRLTALSAKLGEKLEIGRFVRRELNSEQKAFSYTHAGSKIVALAIFDDPEGGITPELGRDVAMHIAAMNPQYLNRNEVPDEVVSREKSIFQEQMADANKPPAIMEKILSGRLNKFYGEVCLEEQIFIKDTQGKLSVKEAVAAVDARARLSGMDRLQVGAGR